MQRDVPASDGLARAARLGAPTTAEGVNGLIAMPGFGDIRVVFDATSAKAHVANAAKLSPLGKQPIDLTPAARGPYSVPAVNLAQHLGTSNVNILTCGGQATIPIVAAVGQVTQVHCAEILERGGITFGGPVTALQDCAVRDMYLGQTGAQS
jgi:acetaldehyde dehydrogenase